MGSAFDSFDGIEGAYYIGAGTSWELIWLVVSVAMCVLALWVGSRHELDAYKKAERK
ncbi:MAG: hypothetical protein AAGF90_21840 [Pseudomonadota bacterium]